MPSERSRGYDDEDEDDRPRRKRRDDDAPRRRPRRDEDDDEDRPRRSQPEKSGTVLVVSIVVGVLLLVSGIVVAVVVTRDKPARNSDDTPANGANNPLQPGAGQPGNNGPAFDAEGLPTGNDLDSVLVRLNRRYQQGEYFRYQLELENLRFMKSSALPRGGEVFRALRVHAGTPAAQPNIGTIPFVAWREMLAWASKDDVPDLCRMLHAERVAQRQADLFGKLAVFKDPRCAEAVAPFLASPERRHSAEQLLKELDSTAEKFVLPYLSANNAKETRVAALQVVAAIGTKVSAGVVEPLTRDPDLQVIHHARIVFETLSKKFGVEQNLLAAVKAIKDGITAQNVSAITDASRQLDKAYRPDHPQRAEIFKGLVECCTINDPKGYGKSAAFLGALKWSSKDDIETLCGLLLASGGESVVFLKLKEYKDPKCSEAVAAFLTVGLKSDEAADVLKAIGAPAEKAVIPYTLRAAPNGAAIPFVTRSAAIELLGDIGTKDCLPLLRQHATELNVQAVSNKAIAKVEARAKTK